MKALYWGEDDMDTKSKETVNQFSSSSFVSDEDDCDDDNNVSSNLSIVVIEPIETDKDIYI